MGLIRRALDSFAGRVLATCGVVLALLLLAGLHLHDLLLARAVRQGLAQLVTERLSIVVETLDAAPPAERPALAAALAAPDLEVAWEGERPQGVDRSVPAPPGRLAGLTSEVYTSAGGLDPAGGVLHWVRFAARLRDGSWVDVRLATLSLLATRDTAFHIYMGLVAACLLLLAGFLAHAIAAPLARLGRAVDRMALDRGAPGLRAAPGGPLEVRRVAEALEALAGRVQGMLRQRSLALAALSHDLMSPLARMKIRLHELPDPALRDSLGHDLQEMETMVSGALAFLRGGDEDEPLTELSLTALVQVVVDECAEAGQVVAERRLDPVRLRGRPVALKRAIRNLVDNALKHGALKHGREPWVEVEEGATTATLRVGDHGPGLPPEARERVFEPFYRGDRARAAGGGSGLGLSTARLIAEAHGGRLWLEAAPGGGLLASLELPRRANPASRVGHATFA